MESLSKAVARYAGKFYDLLTTCNTGADLLARIVPHSDKSGASMRAHI